MFHISFLKPEPLVQLHSSENEFSSLCDFFLLHMSPICHLFLYATIWKYMKQTILFIVFLLKVLPIKLYVITYSLHWCRFAHPYLAFLMFVPTSLIGLLLPRLTWVFPYKHVLCGTLSVILFGYARACMYISGHFPCWKRIQYMMMFLCLY